ncbi:hypothetical protein [Xanthomonas euroxanthea]
MQRCRRRARELARRAGTSPPAARRCLARLHGVVL